MKHKPSQEDVWTWKSRKFWLSIKAGSLLEACRNNGMKGFSPFSLFIYLFIFFFKLKLLRNGTSHTFTSCFLSPQTQFSIFGWMRCLSKEGRNDFLQDNTQNHSPTCQPPDVNLLSIGRTGNKILKSGSCNSQMQKHCPEIGQTSFKKIKSWPPNDAYEETPYHKVTGR